MIGFKLISMKGEAFSVLQKARYHVRVHSLFLNTVNILLYVYVYGKSKLTIHGKTKVADEFY